MMMMMIYTVDVHIFKASVTTCRKLQKNDGLIGKYFELGAFVLFKTGLLPQGEEENNLIYRL